MRPGEPITVSRIRQSVETQIHRYTMKLRGASPSQSLCIHSAIEALSHVRSLLIQSERSVAR